MAREVACAPDQRRCGFLRQPDDAVAGRTEQSADHARGMRMIYLQRKGGRSRAVCARAASTTRRIDLALVNTARCAPIVLFSAHSVIFLGPYAVETPKIHASNSRRIGRPPSSLVLRVHAAPAVQAQRVGLARLPAEFRAWLGKTATALPRANRVCAFGRDPSTALCVGIAQLFARRL
jgi:hypothetical protein